MKRYTQKELRNIALAFEYWYGKEGRHFLWRDSEDPYVKIIAEIFLKRSQAKRVEEFLPRFLRKYPSPAIIVSTKDKELSVDLSELGLVTQRVPHIKELAHALEKDPNIYKTNVKLPGVGDYTFRAIQIFMLGKRTVLFDTNTLRIFSALLGVTYKKSDIRNFKPARELGDSLVAQCKNPVNFNYALLDFGALVFTARAPGERIDFILNQARVAK